MSSSSASQGRRAAAAIVRPTAATLQPLPASPQTPLNRSLSGVYSSPGSYRTDDEAILIYQVGARYIKIGLSGEPQPRCIASYNPYHQRIAGDHGYRASDSAATLGLCRYEDGFYEGYELWWQHMTDLDLRLARDRLERIFRDMETKKLLLDHRQKRAALVVSSGMPRPLLCSLLAAVFTVEQPSNITLLPISTLTAIGAGLRTALVVDLGWSESTVSAVSEYLEIHQRRSVRAGKLLNKQVRVLLKHAKQKPQPSFNGLESPCTLDIVEEIIQRACWCRTRASDSNAAEQQARVIMACTVKGRPKTPLSLPRTSLAEIVEKTFLVSELHCQPSDDHNLPIPHLIYAVLKHLPIDLRKLCMSRIVFTGGCSGIPGLKARILEEVEVLAHSRRWNSIKARGAGIRTGDEPFAFGTVLNSSTSADGVQDGERGQINDECNGAMMADADIEQRGQFSANDRMHASNECVEPPRILSRIDEPRSVHAVPRSVDSIGPWQGASLIASLRVKGAIEIEKDKFWQHGLAGVTNRRDGYMGL